MLSISLSDGRYHFLCVVNVRVQGSVFNCTWIPCLRDSFLSKQDWDACFLLCSVLIPDSWSKGCAYLSRKREAGLEIGNIPSLLPSTPFLLLTHAEKSAEWGSPWERVAEWWGDELQKALEVARGFLLGDSNNAIVNQNATDWKQKKLWLVTAQRLFLIKDIVKMLVRSWTVPFGECLAFCFVFQIKCRDSNAKKKKKKSWRKFFRTCCSLWLALQVKVLKPYWLWCTTWVVGMANVRDKRMSLGESLEFCTPSWASSTWMLINMILLRAF